MRCIHHHEHFVTYCAFSASENWRSLTDNFARMDKTPTHALFYSLSIIELKNARWNNEILQELGQCGCLWSLILGGSMKSCCGRLGETFVNSSVSHGMWALCSLWNTMKSCVSLKQEQYYYWKCVVVILCKGTFEMAFVGYMYNLETFSGRY